MAITSVTFGIDHGIPDFLKQLEEELGPDLEDRAGKACSCDPHCAIDCRESVKLIDRFRDKVSAYYGFKNELIMPVFISDTSDPLKKSTFTVLGIEYEVSDAILTCVGEVSYER